MSRRIKESSRATAAKFGVVALLAVGLTAPASASAGVLDSLSGWWPMYEGSGQVVHDLSGHGDNGMLGSTPGVDANDPTWIRGLLFGSALRFDGNDLVRIPDSPALDSKTVTVSAWVRSSTPLGAHKYVVGKGATNYCDASTYGLYTGSDGGLRFYMEDQNDHSLLHGSGSVAPASIWNGKWHHVAGTYDGTTAKLFLDGKLVPGGEDFPSAGIPYVTQDLGLGDFLEDCDLYYTGDIDEVAVFNQALPIDRYWSALSLLFTRPLR
jgi:hypothetical protein